MFSINIKSKKITKLFVPEAIDTRGIDGLYLYKNSLIITQNGFNPNRVAQLYFKNNSISSYRVLEANHSLINDPTLGMIINDEFIFIANSGWNDLAKNNQLKPEAKLRETSILKLSLKR